MLVFATAGVVIAPASNSKNNKRKTINVHTATVINLNTVSICAPNIELLSVATTNTTPITSAGQAIQRHCHHCTFACVCVWLCGQRVLKILARRCLCAVGWWLESATFQSVRLCVQSRVLRAKNRLNTLLSTQTYKHTHTSRHMFVNYTFLYVCSLNAPYKQS